jgi:hypothetical protein
MLTSGTVISGKWTHQRLGIERPIGQGANGAVYLVRTGHGLAAMKVCDSSADVAMEWSVLERMRGGAFPRPFFIDDAADAPSCYFYVMEWVPGQPLDQWARRLREAEWDELVRQLLIGLATLHRSGQAFCDVKPQNILVTCDGRVAARFVDVGGVTPFGRSVRQFTPTYDRAYWGMGDRRADARYDLFALALVVWFGQGGDPPTRVGAAPVEQRRRWLGKEQAKMARTPRGSVLASALTGQFDSAEAMLTAWQAAQRGAPYSPSMGTVGGAPGRVRASTAGTSSQGQVAAAVGATRAAQAVRTAYGTKPPRGVPPARATAGTSSSRGLLKPRRRRPQHAAQTAHLDWSEWLMWGSVVLAVATTAAAWLSYASWA